MSTLPQENTAKRIATDLLIALLHNNRLFPPHHDNQEELTLLQSNMLDETYQGLLKMLDSIKTKDNIPKRLAADILIAAIHTGRFRPNNVPQREEITEQLRLLTKAYETLIHSVKGAKEI